MDIHLRNVLLLGMTFSLFRIADQTIFSIQAIMTSSMQKEDSTFHGDAYYSQAIFYGFFSIFIWAVPSVISATSPKFSMSLGATFHVLFIAQFLFPHTWSVYLLSGLAGFGGALLWIGQENYLTVNSKTDTISKHSGIFSVLSNLSMLVGNVFIMCAFKGKEEIDEKTRLYVIVTLVVFDVISIVTFALLPKMCETEKGIVEIKPDNPVAAFLGAIKLFFTPAMCLLSISSLYTGLEMGFFGGVYSSCIGFTRKFDNRKELVGISGLFLGFGEVFGSGMFSAFGYKLGRIAVIIIGCVVHASTFCLIYLNLPDDSPFSDTDSDAIINSSAYVAVLCSFLLGLGDAIYNNVIPSFLGTVYADNCAPAFSIFQFYQSIGSVVALITAQLIGLHYQLIILSVILVIGTICYIKVEFYIKNRISLACDADEIEKLYNDPKQPVDNI